MSPTEHERHDLFLALERALGTEPARALMEQLPPRRWDDLATRDDLRAIDAEFARIDQRFEQVDQRFEQVDQRFDRLEQRMEGVERHLIRIDERFVALEHRLLAEFRHEIIGQNRLLFFSMTGAIFTAASLAFAAVRF